MARQGDKGTYQGQAVEVTKVNGDLTLNLRAISPSGDPPVKQEFTSVAASQFTAAA